MPSILATIGAVVMGLTAVGFALPAVPKLTAGQMKIHEAMKRQAASQAANGLGDVDILQFALTLEWLETTFYQQGFQKFPAANFKKLGLSDQQVTDLTNVGATEQAHVILLQSAIAQTGVQPVQPCTYDFGFTDAAGMITTASVLENVGVSAYMGAAPLLADKSILGTAASILTVEARHQTFIRAVSKAAPVPQPFDTPLSAKQVFSLAAPFIKSCPKGSDLALTAFPSLTAADSKNAKAVPGASLKLKSDAAAKAKFCAFSSGGIPGGTAFAPFTVDGGCIVPQGLAGIVYINLASAGSPTGKISDDIIVAGPMVMQFT